MHVCNFAIRPSISSKSSTNHRHSVAGIWSSGCLCEYRFDEKIWHTKSLVGKMFLFLRANAWPYYRLLWTWENIQKLLQKKNPPLGYPLFRLLFFFSKGICELHPNTRKWLPVCHSSWILKHLLTGKTCRTAILVTRTQALWRVSNMCAQARSCNFASPTRTLGSARLVPALLDAVLSCRFGTRGREEGGDSFSTDLSTKQRRQTSTPKMFHKISADFCNR